MRIGINTGGGDAPGLNAVIHAVVLAAHHRGWEVHGIQTGYGGLLEPGRTTLLTPAHVESIVDRGGTILGTTNRADPFHFPVTGPTGEVTFTDRSDEVVRNFRALELDALVAVGGDGSMALAARFAAKGIPVIGVPKTIDNDLADTNCSFGFDTAVSTATEAVDKLHSTASAHQRVFVVEVMGRYVGWIALHTGLTGSADVILLPEIPFDLEHVAAKIRANERRGKAYGIIVAAEGARPVGGQLTTRSQATPGRQEPLLGGIAEWVAREVGLRTGKETRTLVLGHLQRGGSPTPFDRLVALRYGAAAVRFLAEGKRNVLVAYQPPAMVPVPLEGAASRRKAVPVDGDTVQTCRELGISFGDAPPLD
jgi:6-phosphofructokinase 1